MACSRAELGAGEEADGPFLMKSFRDIPPMECVLNATSQRL